MKSSMASGRGRRATALPRRVVSVRAPLTPTEMQMSSQWPAAQHISLRVSVRIPLRGLRLRELEALQPGMTIESPWPATEEVPLFAQDVALSWCEFEGLQQTMAVRLTHLQ